MSELPETIEGLEDLAVQYFKKTDNPDAQYFTISDFLLEARKQAFKEVLSLISEDELQLPPSITLFLSSSKYNVSVVDKGFLRNNFRRELRASIKKLIKQKGK